MFVLHDLPYEYDALAPTISGATMHLHHDKHHAAYVKKTNELAGAAGLADRPLEEVIKQARTRGLKPLFNNAAQAWNHAFFWNCMTPGGSKPDGDLDKAIADAFGGLDQLKAKFVEEGAGHFGSGWVWLIAEGGALKVISTHDGEDTLDRQGVVPLMACDLWEHAYYVDYRNDRAAFLKAWFDALPNWAFAAKQLAAAKGQGAVWTHP